MILATLAPAKLNLGLSVLGKREDGFHNIQTIMQSVSLFDRIELVWPGRGQLWIDGIDVSAAPNLMMDAALAMTAEFGKPVDFDMRLQKRIPVSAGLGGGSSDAAAVLRILAKWWDLDASHQIRIERVAVNVGSDVAFFLSASRALVTGKGDEVELRSPSANTWYTIVSPGIFIADKTTMMYQSLLPSDFQPVASDSADLFNSFLQPLLRLSAPFSEFYGQLQRTAVAENWYLTGAGPSLYTIQSDAPSLGALTRSFQLDCPFGCRIRICRNVCGLPPIVESETIGRFGTFE